MDDYTKGHSKEYLRKIENEKADGVVEKGSTVIYAMEEINVYNRSSALQIPKFNPMN